MRLRNLALIIGLGAFSAGAFAQGVPDYDDFSTFPTTSYLGEYWDFGAAANEWYASEMTLASLNPVKTVSWWLANTNAQGGASISPTVNFDFYNNNAGAPGSLISSFSVSYGALTAGFIYSSVITLNGTMSLAGATSNTIWVAVETSTADMGIGIGSAPSVGTGFDVLGESSTGAGGSFTIFNSPFGGGTTGPKADFAISLSPEPCSMAILGFGAVGMIARRRRNKV